MLLTTTVKEISSILFSFTTQELNKESTRIFYTEINQGTCIIK